MTGESSNTSKTAVMGRWQTGQSDSSAGAGITRSLALGPVSLLTFGAASPPPRRRARSSPGRQRGPGEPEHRYPVSSRQAPAVPRARAGHHGPTPLLLLDRTG